MNPSSINLKGFIPKHFISKLLDTKDKQKILKEAREEQHIKYKESTIRSTCDFSSTTMEARRQWDSILKMLKVKHWQPEFYFQ